MSEATAKTTEMEDVEAEESLSGATATNSKFNDIPESLSITSTGASRRTAHSSKHDSRTLIEKVKNVLEKL